MLVFPTFSHYSLVQLIIRLRGHSFMSFGEIQTAIKERLSHPIIGTFTLLWSISNWPVYVVLVFGSSSHLRSSRKMRINEPPLIHHLHTQEEETLSSLRRHLRSRRFHRDHDLFSYFQLVSEQTGLHFAGRYIVWP
jgi:hypothetical protein